MSIDDRIQKLEMLKEEVQLCSENVQNCKERNNIILKKLSQWMQIDKHDVTEAKEIQYNIKCYIDDIQATVQMVVSIKKKLESMDMQGITDSFQLHRDTLERIYQDLEYALRWLCNVNEFGFSDFKYSDSVREWAKPYMEGKCISVKDLENIDGILKEASEDITSIIMCCSINAVYAPPKGGMVKLQD